MATLTDKIWKLASYSAYDFLGFGSEEKEELEQNVKEKETEKETEKEIVWPSFVRSKCDNCLWGAYDEPNASDFDVRGKDYLNDAIKHKSGASLFKLAHLELYECSVANSYHIASHSASWYHKYNEALPRNTFFFIYNMQLDSLNTAAVATFVRCMDGSNETHEAQPMMLFEDEQLIDEMLNVLSDSDCEEKEEKEEEKEEKKGKQIVFTEDDIENIPNIEQTVTHNDDEYKSKCWWRPKLGYKPYELIWDNFLNGDELFINQRLKIIPKLVQGSWYFTFPQRPALLGMKTPQRCYRGPNYLEIDCEADHSMIASQITKAAYHISNYLVVDIMLTIEGQQHNELPERCIGGFQIRYCDTTKAKKLVA